MKNALEQIIYMLLGRILSGINRDIEYMLCHADAVPFIHLFSLSSRAQDFKTPP